MVDIYPSICCLPDEMDCSELGWKGHLSHQLTCFEDSLRFVPLLRSDIRCMPCGRWLLTLRLRKIYLAAFEYFNDLMSFKIFCILKVFQIWLIYKNELVHWFGELLKFLWLIINKYTIISKFKSHIKEVN